MYIRAYEIGGKSGCEYNLYFILDLFLPRSAFTVVIVVVFQDYVTVSVLSHPNSKLSNSFKKGKKWKSLVISNIDDQAENGITLPLPSSEHCSNRFSD